MRLAWRIARAAFGFPGSISLGVAKLEPAERVERIGKLLMGRPLAGVLVGLGPLSWVDEWDR